VAGREARPPPLGDYRRNLMHPDPTKIGSLAESCYGDEQRERHLEPGQEICDCGAVTESDERHRCAHCGHKGCIQCMRVADDTGNPETNETWVCNEEECEIGYLEELAKSEERSHVTYQDFIARQIDAVRHRKLEEAA